MKATQDCPVCKDVLRRLKGHPDSKLNTDAGLAAATMRKIEQLEEACRVALWIRDKLKERNAFGSNFEEWIDISNALDIP